MIDLFNYNNVSLLLINLIALTTLKDFTSMLLNPILLQKATLMIDTAINRYKEKQNSSNKDYVEEPVPVPRYAYIDGCICLNYI